jgi:hypothetical protein
VPPEQIVEKHVDEDYMRLNCDGEFILAYVVNYTKVPACQ